MNEYVTRAKKFKTKKTLGQNFLVSGETIEFISNFANKDDIILEIGPGIGFVTEKLVQTAKKVVAVELDPAACSHLKKNLGSCDNFILVEGDILKTDIPALFEENEKIKVIANIPYYITTPILLHLLGEIDDVNYKTRGMVSDIILMVQEEVAKRIVADNTAKNKEYGLLSILSNFWADTEIVKYVPRRFFCPAPKVNSAIVKFKINSTPRVNIVSNLRNVIKAGFSQRRKNIKNCLKNAGFLNVENALLKCGFDLNLRAENFSIQDFYKLSLELLK